MVRKLEEKVTINGPKSYQKWSKKVSKLVRKVTKNCIKKFPKIVEKSYQVFEYKVTKNWSIKLPKIGAKS